MTHQKGALFWWYSTLGAKLGCGSGIAQRSRIVPNYRQWDSLTIRTYLQFSNFSPPSRLRLGLVLPVDPQTRYMLWKINWFMYYWMASTFFRWFTSIAKLLTTMTVILHRASSGVIIVFTVVPLYSYIQSVKPGACPWLSASPGFCLSAEASKMDERWRFPTFPSPPGSRAELGQGYLANIGSRYSYT